MLMPPKIIGHYRKEVIRMADTQQKKTEETVKEAVVAKVEPTQPVVPVVEPVQTPQATPEPVQPTTQPQSEVATDKERSREQFEKLLDSNKRLYESNELLRQELQQRQVANQTFAPIQQPPVQQPSAQDKGQGVSPDDFVEVDPVTGEKFVNETKLQSKIQELNSKATRAEQAIQQYIRTTEQREVEKQNKEAFTAYPALDPSNPNFDVSMHNQTRAVIYDSLINPQDYGGKPLAFKEAADFVKSQFRKVSPIEMGGKPDVSQIPTQEPKESKAQPEVTQDLKAQASASVAGEQPTTRPQAVDTDEMSALRLSTRKGSVEALAKRLMNTPHAGTPTGGAAPGEAS